MPNITIPLKSAAKLELQMPSFANGTRLYKVLANEIKGIPFDMKITSMEALAAAPDLGPIKGVVLQILGSDAVESVVFDCLAGCLYNGARITRDTFEDERARGDWLPCAWEVIKFTLAPFFGSLDFGSATPPAGATGSPKSTSTLSTATQ